MKPLLAHTYESRLIYFPCYVQPKFNGIRALYQNGSFQSRDELPWNAGVLRHLSDQLLNLFDSSVVLDGELYHHGWPLQRINGAVAINRREPNEDTIQVDYFVYDQVRFDLPFGERFAEISAKLNTIEALVERGSPCAATTILVSDVATVNSFYAMCVDQKFEGIMYRLGDCPYTLPKQPLGTLRGGRNNARALSDKNNRTWHLIKRKDWQDDEFLITGIVEGEGKRSSMVGAIELIARNGRSFRCGTGFTEDQAITWWNTPALIVGHFAKIQYLVLSDLGIPMNNSLIQIL